MKLFADIYLDEDVSVLVAILLRGRGLDAVTAVAEGMLGQDDSAQLARAASMARCVVTHNRVHFELLHRQYLASGRDHAGIIVATRRAPHEVASRIVMLLMAYWAAISSACACSQAMKHGRFHIHRLPAAVPRKSLICWAWCSRL